MGKEKGEHTEFAASSAIFCILCLLPISSSPRLRIRLGFRTKGDSRIVLMDGYACGRTVLVVSRIHRLIFQPCVFSMPFPSYSFTPVPRYLSVESNHFNGILIVAVDSGAFDILPSAGR
jgi:hypothetical protein